MVVDSSALLATRLREPDWSAVLDVLNAAKAPVMAAPTWLETCLVFDNRATERASRHFGDCIAYALAKSTNQPLLFKGDDFTHTDITPAMP